MEGTLLTRFVNVIIPTVYTQTLGLQVVKEGGGLRLHLPGGGTAFAYPKDNHLERVP